MITISDSARKYFLKLLDQQENGTQIRIFVNNPGKPEAECTVSYCQPHNVKDTDTKLKFKKLSVYIDPISLPYLKSAEIDLAVDDLGSQLTLKAPNATKSYKLPENTPIYRKVEYLLYTQINPRLAEHGGHVSLVEITDDNYAVLKFGGGCNGCAMINVTLKDSVEKEILLAFPFLKGVIDNTEHLHGRHSYF
ncbi:iron-sulfur cluster biogenesis protein NfuA [Candidatus Pantoea edessiphila]|uniref:Fe/S biogenesis protein NfuA n=1 Tax=Candidatus Pantoea edessiphila TaxID=2044610 RepID=A0A2P5SXT9_9GAMM|nr:Fe-S biogenesis protein NfuA [Candidatus Pantoea edessiphila]MBK4775762.1 Fe-S biogenesis protein NfuA [Pantoea sp. Edef]PPI87158.1 iron-sulfur cluster biogenesis protein NfuA [Candidatus Pantoea edessiphila]